MCAKRPITLNMGMSMPGWFDLNSLEEVDFREDKEGIEASTRYRCFITLQTLTVI